MAIKSNFVLLLKQKFNLISFKKRTDIGKKEKRLTERKRENKNWLKQKPHRPLELILRLVFGQGDGKFDYNNSTTVN